MTRQNNKRPWAGLLLGLVLFAGACSGEASEEPSASPVSDPPAALANADTANDDSSPDDTSPDDAVRAVVDAAPEPVAMVDVLMNSGMDNDLAVCYSDVLAQNGVTEVADFDELADALTEVTVEQATEMDACFAASQN